MKSSVLSHALLASTLTASTLLLPLALQAEETSHQSDEWKISSSIYVWAAGVGGDVKNGGEIDVPFSDLVETLDMSFMGNIEARRGQWFVSTDLISIDLSDDADGLINPDDAGDVAVKGSYDLSETIVTPTVGYNLIDSKTGTLDAFVGAQYVYLDTTIKLSSTGASGNHYKKVSETGHILDGVVGVKGQLNLEGNWYIPYYVDIGAGDSDFTWQSYTGISYHMGQTNLFLGYRYLEWDMDSKVIDNLNLNGPIFGARYNF